MENITKSCIPLQKPFKIDNLQCIFLEPTAVRSKLLSINIRVRESYCIRLQTSRKSNLENRTRRSKIRRIGISVIRNCPITDNYMFLHDKITNQITITTFCTAKYDQSKYNYKFCTHLTDANTD